MGEEGREPASEARSESQASGVNRGERGCAAPAEARSESQASGVNRARERSPIAFEGQLSPPRKNGELQFAEPWESRVFGLTMTLYESGAFEWSEFQALLIDSIGAWEREHGTSGDGYRYWERWLEAFEQLAARKQLLAPGALEARIAKLSARPAGWDHP